MQAGQLAMATIEKNITKVTKAMMLGINSFYDTTCLYTLETMGTTKMAIREVERSANSLKNANLQIKYYF